MPELVGGQVYLYRCRACEDDQLCYHGARAGDHPNPGWCDGTRATCPRVMQEELDRLVLAERWTEAAELLRAFGQES